MENVDIDQNGTIDYNEFVCACLKMKNENSQKLLKEAFEMFDKDNNG
jgi:Ca2+-binding EF-hand superfamily protein